MRILTFVIVLLLLACETKPRKPINNTNRVLIKNSVVSVIDSAINTNKSSVVSVTDSAINTNRSAVVSVIDATFDTNKKSHALHSSLVIDSTVSIAEGFKMLGKRDTLFVRGGIRDENLMNIIPSDKKLFAYNGEKVIIKPSSGVFALHIMGRNRVEIKGFVFDGEHLTNSAIKITKNSNNGKLIEVEVRNTWFNGVLINSNSNGWIFDKLYIHSIGVREDTINTKFTHGIYLASSGHVIKNSKIDGISGSGVQMWNSRGGSLPSDNTIINNSISNVGLSGNGAGILLAKGSYHKAFNNTIKNAPIGLRVDYGTKSAQYSGNIIINSSRDKYLNVVE